MSNTHLFIWVALYESTVYLVRGASNENQATPTSSAENITGPSTQRPFPTMSLEQVAQRFRSLMADALCEAEWGSPVGETNWVGNTKPNVTSSG